MIQLQNITKSYGDQKLFEGLSVNVEKGEKIGLVGRNGSGKSTLFRLITGTEIADQGEIQIAKDYKIGTLEQHTAFHEATVFEEATLGLPPAERDKHYLVEKILFGLGFNQEQIDSPPSKCSGGYQLRLKLAKVLLSDPDCLLLDEPTNYLDIVSIRWLEHYLQRWRGELILISHDREFMDQVTNNTMGIHRHRLRKYKGDTEAYFSQILQEEEIHEKTRVKLSQKKEHLEKFITRFGAKATKATQAQSKMKALNRMPVLEKLAQIEQLDFAFNVAPLPGKKVLIAEDLSFSYDDKPLINDVSFRLEKGERIAIIGKNGRGKSTLMRLLTGDLSLQGGHLDVSPNLEIGYFGQTNIERLNLNATIEEEISASNLQLNRTEIRKICGAMMFPGDMATKPCRVLSGGERSRVLLGKILAKKCNLLLLDEPTHHLDMESIESLIAALEEFDGTVVIVTHSELILNTLPFDALIICRERQQEYFPYSYEEFLAKGGWEEVKKPPKEKKERNDKPKINTKKIQGQLEAQITQKEIELSVIEQELIAKASTAPRADLDKLGAAAAAKKSEIEKLYAEWETYQD